MLTYGGGGGGGGGAKLSQNYYFVMCVCVRARVCFEVNVVDMWL